MNAESLYHELQMLIAIQTRGLAQHVTHSMPYLTAHTYPLWNLVQRITRAEKQSAERVGALLDRLDLPLRPASFSIDVAYYHYADLTILLPKIIEEKRRQVEACRRAIELCDSPQQNGAASELQQLLNESQAQLEELEGQQRQIMQSSDN